MPIRINDKIKMAATQQTILQRARIGPIMAEFCASNGPIQSNQYARTGPVLAQGSFHTVCTQGHIWPSTGHHVWAC